MVYEGIISLLFAVWLDRPELRGQAMAIQTFFYHLLGDFPSDWLDKPRARDVLGLFDHRGLAVFSCFGLGTGLVQCKSSVSSATLEEQLSKEPSS